MEDEFKIPTFDPKLKVTTKTVNSQTNDSDPSKGIPSTSSIAVPNESESGKVESNVTKVFPKCPYVEPKWSHPPDSNLIYSFEVLKGGQIVENVTNLQSKAFWKIGKLPNNDIVMAHPTISRFHAVIQYRPNLHSSDNSDDEDDVSNSQQSSQKPKIEKGWYLYDLNSTHGTFLNKMKVPPKTYVRLRVGYMLKFGSSTRNYILQGPGFDEEAESELTITEMKELRLKKQQEVQEKLIEEERQKEEQGISWGMTEDADEETDLTHNPFASTNNEELFLQDPKKTLRGFFEREGLDLDYKVDEISNGTYTCRIELPMTDAMGRNIVAEFTHKGKKKECVVQCALEACRILDRNGLLRQANHEPRKRKFDSSDDDDDDEFFDRTTQAEEKRRRKTGACESVTLSYDQLLEEENKLKLQLAETEKLISRYQRMEKDSKEKEAIDVDDLDVFMSNLSSEKQMDKIDVRKSRLEMQRIKADIEKVRKLQNIARPIALPPLKQSDRVELDESRPISGSNLPLFGKIKTFGFDKLKSKIQNQRSSDTSRNEEDESIEEFDDDDGAKTAKSPVPNEKSMTKSSEKPEQCITKEPSVSKDETDSQRISNQEIIGQETIIHSELRTGNKNKNRNKNCRNKIRNQIDIDDDEDNSPQKYSGWIPPNNQTGDGMTELNSKYGY